MQLILIIQVAIALLANELSGSLPLGAWTGLELLIATPLFVLVHGFLMCRHARVMIDRGSAVGVERAYGAGARVGLLVAACLLLAACSALPQSLVGAVGRIAPPVVFLGVAVLSALVHEASLWPIERRVRESALVRALDDARPVQPTPGRWAFVLARARAGLLPMLAPLLVPLALGELASEAAGRIDPEMADLARLGGGIAGAALLFMLVPLLVPPLLGLRRLEPGPIRNGLEAMAAKARVSMREIWVWPTDGLVANAAVMGVVPGLRCVMLSDALLEGMPRPQLEAVMAHELGHVVRRHLPWLVVVILASWILAAAVVQPLAEFAYGAFLARAEDATPESVAQALVMARDLGVFALGLAIFGFVSRRFERQADTFAVQLLSEAEGSPSATRTSVDAMVSALGAVALLNHVRRTRGSWRHGSIEWRQRYLASVEGYPLRSMPIDWVVALLRWGAAAIVAAAVLVELMGP